ncbi:MAG TPA: phosphatidate cytidylyltransferase [Dehalococcoidia bacterium]
MLAQRVATAAVGIPVLVGLIYLGGLPFAFAATAVIFAATLEFYTAASLSPRRPLALMGAAFAASFVPASELAPEWRIGLLTGLILLTLAVLVLEGQVRDGFTVWMWVLAGALYVGWLGHHLFLIREDLAGGRDWLFLAVFGTFATDTGAYVAGRALGRRPLAPAISPKKTVEGAAGGVVAGLAAVVALSYLPGVDISLPAAGLLGLLVPVAAQLGDLAESLIKRGLGLKDTGHLLPGHGGLLDRLDSLLFVGVVVYYYAVWLGT